MNFDQIQKEIVAYLVVREIRPFFAVTTEDCLIIAEDLPGLYVPKGADGTCILVGLDNLQDQWKLHPKMHFSSGARCPMYSYLREFVPRQTEGVLQRFPHELSPVDDLTYLSSCRAEFNARVGFLGRGY